MATSIFQWPVGRAIAGRKATKFIAVHCTATREGQDISAKTVDGWHIKQGWQGIGYHYLIRLDGSIEAGRPEGAQGSHVAGFNSVALGVVYVGGLTADGKTPKDTRTPEQKAALVQLLKHLKARYPQAVIQGHRDFSPDKNGNGVIEPHEWLKACPCFDAKREYAAL